MNRNSIPLKGDDRHKIFLTNLDGRINIEDLNKVFHTFGDIEHIESITEKSAIVLFKDLVSVDRVMKKHRKLVIKNQEIYIRRIRYGFIDRPYMDTTIVMIRPMVNDELSSTDWSEHSIRRCFSYYENSIERIHISSNSSHTTWICFDDFDVVDRILVDSSNFRVDGCSIKICRAPMEQTITIEKNNSLHDRKSKSNSFGFISSCYVISCLFEEIYGHRHHEIQSLRNQIIKLQRELAIFKNRSHSSS